MSGGWPYRRVLTTFAADAAVYVGRVVGRRRRATFAAA
jgi:hypothetical protein